MAYEEIAPQQAAIDIVANETVESANTKTRIAARLRNIVDSFLHLSKLKQETGVSVTDVMHQKGVTDAIEAASTLEYVESVGDIRFDVNRSYGMNAPLSGNFVFNFTGAKDDVLSKAFHNGIAEPTYSGLGAVTLYKRGTYLPGTVNLLTFMCHKASSAVVAVTVTYN